MSKKLVIASTSTIHGGRYLDYLKPTLTRHFIGIRELLFIPYARPGGISHDDYTAIAHKAFKELGIAVIGIHKFQDPLKAVANAQAIFTGGGNTFVLVNQLHKLGIMPVLQDALHKGIPYLGTSAGSNICGVTMQTTNDMPIVYPPSFKTLGVVPFNINPHYLDPDPSSTHMGETREKRIQEFHAHNSLPVIGLREGSWLQVSNQAIQLNGIHSARIFEAGKAPYELESGSAIEL